MSVDFVFLAMDAFAVFAMALIGIQYLWLLPRNANAQLLGVLCLAAICHVVLGRYQYGYWIAEPFRITLSPLAESILNLGRNVAPGVFLFLSHSMLRDGKRLPKTLLALFVIQLFLEEPIHFVVGQGFPAERLLTEIVPTLLQSVFAGWAILWIVAEWKPDLIEARRGVRFLFLLVVGVVMLLAGLLQRIVIPTSEIENYYVHMSLIGIHTLVVFVVLVRTLSRDGTHLFQLRVDDPGAAANDVGSREPLWAEAVSEGGAESKGPVDMLVRLLDADHVYRRPKLSIRSLADELGLPEYRLRKLIHEELGFRNFNAFLHHYRLREACAMLADPGQVRTPILTIALTVGYQSINTFNRAFREYVGETPSTFRARTLGGPDG
ncbi:MAG: helix-turn-helix transcriptional regulator [Gammaproteobacteria bacterium]|nr:helix-turn-helix transcriptional regulator [Gammaproteobacteria bacterium]